MPPPPDRTARRIRGLAVFYAALPALGAVLWLMLGDDDPERNRSPVEFVPIFEALIILVALGAGLNSRALLRGLTQAEKAALTLFAAVFATGLATAAPDPLHGLERAGFTLLHVMTALSLAHLIALHAPARRLFALALVAQPLVHLPLLVLLYLLHADDPQMNWLGGPVGYWHVRIWGTSLAVALAAALGLYAAARPQAAGHVLWAGVIAVLAALMGFSGFRAGLVALPVAAVAMLLVAPRAVLRRLPGFALAVAIGLAASLLIPPPIEDYGIFNSLAEGAAAPGAEADGRMALWARTLDLIQQRPMLGHGYDQFRFIHQTAGLEYVQPHSVVLNLAVDFGVIGGLALAFVLISLYLRGALALHAAPVPGPGRLAGFAVLSVLVVMAQVDGALYHPEPLLAAAIAFALLLAAPRADGLPDDA